jgi:hypothetical protein
MENHDEDMVPSVPVAITNQRVINWFVTTRNNASKKIIMDMFCF